MLRKGPADVSSMVSMRPASELLVLTMSDRIFAHGESDYTYLRD